MATVNHTDGTSIADQLEDQYAIQIAIVSLRLILGWVFFYSGITKVLDPEWTASGYLMHAVPDGNPFMGVWLMLAGLPLVDILVQFGLTLVGLGIMLGAFTRWNAFWAAVMMLLFWASSLPLEHGIIVDDHVVYIAVLFVLSALRAGRIAGLDPYLESFVSKDSTWLRKLRD